MHIHHTDVVVAGAGPVGLAAALFLHNSGHDVIVAEEKPAGVTHSYALALHPSSLRLLDTLGVADHLLSRARKIATVGVYINGRREFSLPVATPDQKYPYIAIVGQDRLEAVLGAELKRRHVPTWWNHRLARFEQEADVVNVQLDELEERTTGYAAAHLDRLVGRTHFVATKYLVGADGHGSLVRRQLGVDFPEVGAAQQFAVFEFQANPPVADEIALVLHEDGLAALWPLPDGRARWSFAVDPARFSTGAREKDHDPVQIVTTGVFPVLTESSFAQLLQERAPWFQGHVQTVYWRMLVRFERRLADCFGLGRVWLAGDSAHLTGPVGIQSMNIGITEARALAGALSTSAAEPRRQQLRAYNDGNMNLWRRLHGLEGGVGTKAGTLPAIEQRKAELISCLPGSGPALELMADALGLTFDAGRFEVPPPPTGG